MASRRALHRQEVDGGYAAGSPSSGDPAVSPHENSYRFFEWAPKYLDVQDPAGYSDGMMKGVDFTRHYAMTEALKTADERSGQALAAENKGGHAEAIRLWRINFGNEFPAYG